MKITTNNTPLTWDNTNKKFKSNNNHYYSISECPTLTFTDDLNRFSFELQIDGLEVRVRTLHINTNFTLSYKKCQLSGDEKFITLIIKDYIALGMKYVTDSYTFKSHKSLTKFIGRLCRVKEVI